MLKVIGRRLAGAIPLLFVIATLTFLLVQFIPGDPAVSILGPDASPEQYERVREDLGLNAPVHVQYFNWMIAAVQGDLGNSIRTGLPVLETILSRLPVTLSLALLSIAVTLVVGGTFGLISALKGGWLGKSAQVVSVLGASIPNFWLGILLVLVFSLTFRLVPATGYVPFEVSPWGWAHSLILPVAAIALAGVAAIARQTRASMLTVLGQDNIRTLLASGTPRRTIVFKHALRNAAIPVVTTLSFQFIHVVGGAVVIEQVFALPGLGQYMIAAISGRDIPVVQGIVLVTAIMIIIVNLVVDLINAWLNPKVRM
ncbi:ABC transporter permease [Microbacterium aerolatum]|uniref:ABC transporter permease n=1 Tax=Microbacterium aerolatum TaxID=153731 RepID=UPI0011BD8815|nr:ABC transporter permease [Microbacterium aerolatum]